MRTTRKGVPIIKLPRTLSFKNNNIVDFNAYLSIFDWNFEGPSIIIDGRACISANYQALSLLIQYLWFLKSKGTYIYTLTLMGIQHYEKCGSVSAEVVAIKY